MLHHLWQPDVQAVTGDVDEEIGRHQEQHQTAGECSQDTGVRMAHVHGAALALELGVDPLLFILAQPPRVFRTVREIEQGDESTDQGRQALENQQPAPAGQSQPVHAQECSGNASADGA